LDKRGATLALRAGAPDRNPFVAPRPTRYAECTCLRPAPPRCRLEGPTLMTPPLLARRSLLLLPLALLFATAAPADGPARKPAPPGKVDFNRAVRPVLSDACFACHGPDAKKRKGGLRLDVRDKTHEKGKLLVPGNPDQSELIRRLVTADLKKRMPPKK